ncbi:MAG TPA: MFS transporter [Streptosporangiaceae bacterium]
MRELRRIATASFIGTALEWYDFFLYGTATALVFNKLFFPNVDPAVGLIASFSTFAIGFVARPVGALIFGHFGDRIGRKRTLIATVTLMGAATGLVGVIPSYASIGLAAPVILAVLRFLQGVSVGGEWSGAMLLTLENAPAERHGRYAAIPQLGSPAGTLLSSGAMTAVAFLPDAQFYSWGWRLPFLAAFVLLGVGLYLRLRVEESPVFQRLVKEDRTVRVPLIEAFRRTGGRMLVSACVAFTGIGAFFLLTTFMISYVVDTLHMSRPVILNATLLAAVLEAVVIVVTGRFVERFGAARVCAVGGLLGIVLAYPVWALVDTRSPVLVTIAVAGTIALLSIPYAPVGAVITNLFPEEIRYSAVSISYNIAGLAGGFVPLLAQSLLGGFGASWPLAILLGLIAAITAAGSFAAMRMRLPA